MTWLYFLHWVGWHALFLVVPSLALVTTYIYCWSRWNFNPLLACLLYNYYCCTFIHKCWQQPAEMWNFACINFKSAMKERTAVHFQSDQYFWPCFEHERWCKHFYGLHIQCTAQYGNMGCWVFKWGVQKWRDFCLKINTLKENYWILRIGSMGRYQRLGIILENKVI